MGEPATGLWGVGAAPWDRAGMTGKVASQRVCQDRQEGRAGKGPQHKEGAGRDDKGVEGEVRCQAPQGCTVATAEGAQGSSPELAQGQRDHSSPRPVRLTNANNLRPTKLMHCE